MHILTKFLVVFAAVLSIFLAALTIAYSANADRIASRVMSATASCAGHPLVMIPAMATKSWRYAFMVCAEGLRVWRSSRNRRNHGGTCCRPSSESVPSGEEGRGRSGDVSVGMPQRCRKKMDNHAYPSFGARKFPDRGCSETKYCGNPGTLSRDS